MQSHPLLKASVLSPLVHFHLDLGLAFLAVITRWWLLLK
jgi:hypothetical protein